MVFNLNFRGPISVFCCRSCAPHAWFPFLLLALVLKIIIKIFSFSSLSACYSCYILLRIVELFPAHRQFLREGCQRSIHRGLGSLEN